MQSGGRRVCFGLSTKDDFQFLRLSWEVKSSGLHQRWFPFAKGGSNSPYYYDVHLVIDWENDGERLKAFANRRTKELFGTASWSRWINNWSHYFRPGLTWPRRTQKGLNLRAMPSGCIFADKGPVVFAPDDDPDELVALLAVMNSALFQMLVELQMAFGSYEVGVIQRTPIPAVPGKAQEELIALAREAHDLQRDRDCTDETTHAFCLPGLVYHRNESLLEGSVALETEAQAAQDRLAALQAEIDDLVFDLYGLSEADREMVCREMGGRGRNTESAEGSTEHAEEERETLAPPADLPVRVQNLLMWCVGVAYGRWDVRKALDPGLLPPLGGPFDPLPRCAPGALVNAAGLPTSQDELGNYPWPIAWDGMLVDDPTHSSDIVTRVRQVLALLWGDRADAIEREACQILGFKTLRDYFRDPRKGFFSFHIKRYSKSRRKAPIYWLLQSEKRGYAVWLYCHRLDKATLYTAGRTYADAKVLLEEAGLGELRGGLDTLEGTARRRREREIERQGRLVAEVIEFRDRLDGIALLNLPPDLNDGVVIGIAPLWELVSWKEAGRTWEKLVAGEYTWSTMSRQMRERGLVK